MRDLSLVLAMSFFTVKNDSSLRLRASQMRIATLGKILNIFPQSLFLVGSDRMVATPDEEGDFETYDMSQDTEWTISGDSSKPTGSHSATDFHSGSTNSPYAYQSQKPEASQPSTSKYSKAGSKAAKWKPSLSLSLMRNKPPGVAKQEDQRGGVDEKD